MIKLLIAWGLMGAGAVLLFWLICWLAPTEKDHEYDDRDSW